MFHEEVGKTIIPHENSSCNANVMKKVLMHYTNCPAAEQDVRRHPGYNSAVPLVLAGFDPLVAGFEGYGGRI
jgi:hypothetical protein